MPPPKGTRMVTGMFHAAVGPVVDPGHLRDDLIEGRVDVVGELDLGDGPFPGGSHSDGRADDDRLGERGVEASIVAEGVGETFGGLEDTALAGLPRPRRRPPCRRGPAMTS